MTRFVGTPLRGIEFANLGDEAVSVRVLGDSQSRLRIDAGGRLTWSSGSVSGDTVLYRDDTNLLKTDDVFEAVGGVITLTTNGVPTSAMADGAVAIDTTNNRFYFRSNSQWRAAEGGATVSASAPGSPLVGSLWYDTTEEELKVYSSSASWVSPGGGNAVVYVADEAPSVDLQEGNLWFDSNALDLYIYYSSTWIQLTDSSAGVTDITDLGDVRIEDAVYGEVLTYDGTEWINLPGGGGGASALYLLDDVSLSSATSGDFLKYNGTDWVNDPINLGTDTVGNYVSDVSGGTGISVSHTPGEGSSPTISLNASLDNLSDVDLTVAPSDGDVLKYNSSSSVWVSGSVAGGGGGTSVTVSDTAPVSPSTGDLWYESDSGAMFVYYDNAWVEVGSGSLYADLESRIVTKGDLIVGIDSASATILPAGTNGYFLKANSSASAGIEWASIPTINALDDIGDVDASSPTSGEYLQWNGSAWINSQVTASASIGDFGIVSPEQYQTLVYDGSEWINEYPTTVSNVNNAEATTLQVGEAVYLYGGTGNHASVKRADNDGDATSAKTVGLVAQAIPSGGNGPVVTRGYVSGIDLSVGYSAGQTLYLGEDGGFTTTKPHAPEHLVYIGVVVRATNNGIIYVAAQNGYELDEIHDVDLVTTPPSSGDFLKYNGTLWVNDAINLGADTVGSYMLDVVGGVGVTISHTQGEGSTASVAIGQDVATSASVTFAQIDTTGNVTVGGNLTVNGTTTTLNTETLTVEDNIIVLNGNVSASPTTDAGIEVERGTETNVVLRWNETTDKWQFTNDGSNYTDLGAGGATISTAPPAAPTEGELWFNSDTAQTYIYYDSSWIEISGSSSGARMLVSSGSPSSPIEGIMWFDADTAQTFVYYDSQWIEIGASAMAAIVAGSAPSSPLSGQIWFNSASGGTYVYYGSASAWIEIGAAPYDNLISSIDAKGDLWVGTANNTVDNLAVGSDGDILVANSSTPTGLEWQTPTYASTGKAIAMSIVFGS